jgi:lipoate-protein ligase A
VERFVHQHTSNTMRRASSFTKVHWLDLRGHGISAIERLLLEEFLLRHDSRSWAIVGTHEPLGHRFLTPTTRTTTRESNSFDPSCIIVMGIGGKPEKLLNIPKVKEDGIMVIKRFSGGGTVVLDPNSIWTTWIGRTSHFPEVDPYPRSIMDWSSSTAFQSVFDKLKEESLQIPLRGPKTMVVECKSCGAIDSVGTLFLGKPPTTTTTRLDIPNFALRENDYVLGEKKVGGNAQSIVKDGWLHHTSFLWDYDPDNMSYLTLPTKRPQYRGDRDHTDFLVKLKDIYPGLTIGSFFKALKSESETKFDLQVVNLPEVTSQIESQFDSLQAWFDTKSRTRIIDL